MSEREFMDADYEVIGMVNRCHIHGPGPGGELPSVALSFIPSDRAALVEALDRRIQQVRRILPYVCAATLLLTGLLLGQAL